MSFQRAVAAFDIESYLLKHGVEGYSDKEWTLTCPQCGKMKLSVNLEKKVFQCWVCTAERGEGRGGLLDLIQLLDGITWGEARLIVNRSFRDHVDPSAINVHLTPATIEVPTPSPVPLPEYAIPIDDTGILPYAVRRGITTEDAKAFGLHWCPAGRYGGRIVFPVWEASQLVYWQARAMWEEKDHVMSARYIKSLNPPKAEGTLGSGDVLFNLDHAKLHPRVAVVEGPIDAIHTGHDAVCTFGKRITPMQVAKLLRAGVSAIDLMWDGPSDTEPHGAWPEMFTQAPQLSSYFDVRLVFLPRGDPGDYTRAQINWIRTNNARPAVASNLMEI